MSWSDVFVSVILIQTSDPAFREGFSIPMVIENAGCFGLDATPCNVAKSIDAPIRRKVKVVLIFLTPSLMTCCYRRTTPGGVTRPLLLASGRDKTADRTAAAGGASPTAVGLCRRARKLPNLVSERHGHRACSARFPHEVHCRIEGTAHGGKRGWQRGFWCIVCRCSAKLPCIGIGAINPRARSTSIRGSSSGVRRCIAVDELYEKEIAGTRFCSNFGKHNPRSSGRSTATTWCRSGHVTINKIRATRLRATPGEIVNGKRTVIRDGH